MPPSDPFITQLEPLRPAIRLHCYRMLGSSHDGDDVVQETMLRAWRAKDSLADDMLLKPWLYRIATNVCFDELKKRPKRHYVIDAYPPTDDPPIPVPKSDEVAWLEPMPSAWLEGVDERSAESRYEQKESVALAFVAALQSLSAIQRAVLLLRDVIGFSAAETAAALETSVDAVNSALFRARSAVPSTAKDGEGAQLKVDSKLLEKYVHAFESANLDALVALFHQDMRTAMPPAAIWVSGRAANERFYRRMFGSSAPGQVRYLPIGINGQPGLAFYRATPDGSFALAAIQAIATRDGAIYTVDHFMLPNVYSLFGVPAKL